MNASSSSSAKASYPPGFQDQPRQVPLREEESKVEKMLAQIIAGLDAQRVYNAQNDTKMASHETSIRNIEIQIGQIASQLNASQRGTLPSDTIPNPRRDDKEECKAIFFRSEGQVPNMPQSCEKSKEVSEVVALGSDDRFKQDLVVVDDESKKRRQVEKAIDDGEKDKKRECEKRQDKKPKTNGPPPYVPPVPFPQRLKKKEGDAQFKKFLEMFKQLHINVPFAEALEKMPKYAKFLKDVLSKKRRFNEFETVAMNEDCSAILQRKLPPKMKDPGSFYIPCNIGKNFQGKALCDLRASVNLMPSAIFNQLGLGEARPTTISLLLADRSVSRPKGIIENVLVKVDKFIFPVDFIVIDCEVDPNIPIIFGRPFLATARTLVDVEKGEITLRVDDEQVSFNMNRDVEYFDHLSQCSFVDILGSGCQDKFEALLSKGHVTSTLVEDERPEDVHNVSSMNLCDMDAYGHEKIELCENVDVFPPNDFQHGQRVLLYNCKIKLFLRKVKFRWSGPFTIVQAYDFGAVELENKKGERFKVFGHRLKHYWGGEIDRQTTSISLSQST